MKNFLKIFLSIVVVFVLASAGRFFYLLNLYQQKTANSVVVVNQNLSNSVCVKGNCFSVELATTDAQREKGLMFRTELDKNKGMIFIFDSDGIYPFWMKNTLIPLDIIWIGSNNKIIFIGKNIQPCKTAICQVITPSASAKYVLEINAGISKEISLEIGDDMTINTK